MKMDQDGHDLAWAKLARSVALFALGELTHFES
jgi:hypothetical protein